MNPMHGNDFIMNEISDAPQLTEVVAFADGSVTPSIMTSPTESSVSAGYFGRVCIVIPTQDFGLVEPFTGGILTKKGTPDTTNSEYVSIVRALEVCKSEGFEQFVVYNDSQGAVARASLPQVKWLPSGEFNPASAFLSRVLDRAGYIRSSGRKVTKRMPPTIAQLEIFDLFQTKGRQFRLTESAVWKKLQSDLAQGRAKTQ